MRVDRTARRGIRDGRAPSRPFAPLAPANRSQRQPGRHRIPTRACRRGTDGRAFDGYGRAPARRGGPATRRRPPDGPIATEHGASALDPGRAPLRSPVRARRVRRRVRRGDRPSGPPIHPGRAAGPRGAGRPDPSRRDRGRRADGRRGRPRAPGGPRPRSPALATRRRARPAPTPPGSPSGRSSCRRTRPQARPPRRLVDDALTRRGPAVPAGAASPSTRPSSGRRPRPRPATSGTSSWPGRPGWARPRLRARAPPRPPRRGGGGRGDVRPRGLPRRVAVERGPSSTRACSSARSWAASTATSGAGTLQVAVRRLPPALLHQHASVVGARAAVPAPRPQRRDQHGPRQPRGDARPRGPARRRPAGPPPRRAVRRRAPAARSGGLRLDVARRGPRAAAGRRAGGSTPRCWR